MFGWTILLMSTQESLSAVLYISQQWSWIPHLFPHERCQHLSCSQWSMWAQTLPYLNKSDKTVLDLKILTTFEQFDRICFKTWTSIMTPYWFSENLSSSISFLCYRLLALFGHSSYSGTRYISGNTILGPGFWRPTPSWWTSGLFSQVHFLHV